MVVVSLTNCIDYADYTDYVDPLDYINSHIPYRC